MQKLIKCNKIHRDKFDSKFPINILGNEISTKAFARNFGVMFHADFNFKCQINIVKSSNYNIHDIRRIHKYLDLASGTTLANTLVSSRLDYCNSLIFSAPRYEMLKLQ